MNIIRKNKGIHVFRSDSKFNREMTKMFQMPTREDLEHKLGGTDHILVRC